MTGTGAKSPNRKRAVMPKAKTIKKTARMFLPNNASKKQIAEYDAALTMATAENDMLLAAEKFLTAHGYTVKFKHKK